MTRSRLWAAIRGHTLVLIGAGTMACGGGDGGTAPPPPPPPGSAGVASVTLSPSVDTVRVGDFIAFTAVAYDSAGQVLAGRFPSWSVSDTALATVGTTGLLHAKATGVVAVVATVEGRADTASGVLAPVVAILRRMPSLFAGDTLLLSTDFSSITGQPVSAPPASWVSRAPSVATVTPEGVVAGHLAGSAVIVAASAGGLDSQVVLVLVPRVRPNRRVSFLHDSTSPTAAFVHELWTADPDGGAPFRPTPADFNIEWYRWSADGSKVVIVGGPKVGLTGSLDLYTMNADGSALQKLPLGGPLVPAWSPDGEQLVYLDGVTGDLAVANADGSAAQSLGTGAGTDTDPAYSPDGRQIAWRKALAADPCAETWIMDADGSHQRRLPLPGFLHPCQFSWSPDGKQLALHALGGLWLVNPDGTGLRPLTPNCAATGVCGTPTYSVASWKTDGSAVAFGGDDGGGSINIIARDGSNLQTFLMFAGASASQPQWSPDGQRLLFALLDPSDSLTFSPAIFGTMNGSGQDTVLARVGFRVGGPRWQP